MQAAKPEPGSAIVTDEAADAVYSASIESWADAGHDAGVRLCRWMVERGAAYDFECGETSAERAQRLGVAP